MKEKKKMRLSVAGGKHTIMDEEELEVDEVMVRQMLMRAGVHTTDKVEELKTMLSKANPASLVPEEPPNTKEVEEGYEYDFVIVFGLPEEKGTGKKKVTGMADLISNLKPQYVTDVLERIKGSCGLEYKLELNSKSAIVCKIRANLNRIREYAALKNYHLVADEFQLQKRVETGWPLYGVGPLVSATYNELGVAEEGGFEIIRRSAENQVLNHGVHYLHAVLHAPHITPWSPFQYIYTNYKLDVDMQDLYERATDYRDMRPMDHPFGDRHRLKLVNRIITEDRPLALERRIAAEAITNYFPLHNKPALHRMQDEWRTNFAWPWNGYITPTPWVLSMVKLDPVREYFGEKIGFYFAFLGWYTSWLVTVAIFGAAIAVHRYFFDFDSEENTLMPVYGVAMQIWAVLMLRLWKQQESLLSLRWGMSTFKDEEDARPGYKGEIVWDIIGSGQRKVIWGSKIPGPPKWAVILGLVSMISCLVGGVYVIRQIVTSVGGINKQTAELIISVLTAFQIELLNAVVKRFAIRLVDGENHRTDSQYEAALITKVFLFQFMNSYFPVYYLAFFQPMVDKNDPELRCSKYECTDKVALLLVVLLAVHCFINSLPSILGGITGSSEDTMKKFDIDEVEEQANMAVYDPSLGPLEDCEQIALQFGYIMLFTTTAPWAPMAALFFNLVEMRLDSRHLLFECQRPVPTSAPGFGKWYDVFCTIVFIGIVTNVALVVFTVDHIPTTKKGEKAWMFICMQYAVYGLSAAIIISIPTTSDAVQIQLHRTSTWVTRIFQREIVLEESPLFDAEDMPEADVLEQNGMSNRELDQYRRPGMAPSEVIKFRRPSVHTVRSRAIIPPTQFPPRSWCFFRTEGSMRQFALKIARSETFDGIILFCIALNTFTLASLQYEPKCCDKFGTPKPLNGCPWNKFGDEVEVYLSGTFFIEFLIKATALGLTNKTNGYFSDGWNCLDFFVVCISIVENIPQLAAGGNLSVLRTFRVLRPLKSLSRFPELGALVKASMDAGEELAGVVLVLIFVMCFFAVFGLQIYKGQFNGRCRLTPYPVTFKPIDSVECSSSRGIPLTINDDCYEDYVAAIASDPASYKCEFADGTTLTDDEWNWRKTKDYLAEGENLEKSVWHKAQDCWWPMDLDDTRLCALPQNEEGQYKCKNPWPAYEPAGFLGDDINDDSVMARTYCGSEYDRWGNARFTDLNFPYGFTRMLAGTYNEDFAWGFTNFDHFGAAMTTIFQCVSMEGWTSVLYMGMDVAGPFFSVILFIALIVLGAFFVLNIVLAILSASVENANAEAEEDAKDDIILGPGHSAVKVDDGRGGDEDDEKGPMCSMDIFVDTYLSNISLVAVGLNTIALSMESYPPSEYDDLCATVNDILTYFFIVELVIKISVMGTTKFFKDNFNIFDFLIVVASVVEIVLALMHPNDSGSGSGGISALRAFRIFRVFKMAKKAKEFQKLLAMMLKSLLGVSNVAILLVLFILIYGLIGMQFFANRMRFDPDTGWKVGFSHDKNHPYNDDDVDIPYHNFDTLYWAMLTVFQVLSGEDWNAIMYDGRRAGASGHKSLGWMASLYFISMVVLGSFIVMNLFLAILLSNLGADDGEEEEEEEEGEAFLPSLFSPSQSAKIALEEDDDDDDDDFALRGGPPQKEVEKETQEQSGAEYCGPLGKQMRDFEKSRLFDWGMLAFVFISSAQLFLDCPLCDPESDSQQLLDFLNTASTVAFTIEFLVKVIAYGFKNDINFPDGFDIDGLEKFDKRAYWNGRDSGGNKFDLLILLSSYVDMASGGTIKPLIAIKAMKPLRLLNRSPGLKMMLTALVASASGVGYVAVVVILFFLIFAVVGVSFMKGGFNTCAGEHFDALPADAQDLIAYPKKWEKLSSTEQDWFIFGDVDLSDDADDSIDKSDFGWTSCQESGDDGYEWSSKFTFQAMYGTGDADEPTSKDLCTCIIDDDAWQGNDVSQNFDNVLNAITLLGEISTTEGWTAIMYAALDSRGPEMMPERYVNIVFPICYFVAFMFIGSFFCVELFVGVIIDKFNELRNSSAHGSAMKTEWQVKHDRKKNFEGAFITMMPKDVHFSSTYHIAEKAEFDAFIMGCIIFNSVLMAASHVGEPLWFTNATIGFNYFFAIVFTGEVVIKITAYGWRRYFLDGSSFGRWNRFDFTVVFGTWLGIVLSAMNLTGLGPIGSLLRMFRLGRIVRLVPKFKVLRKLAEVISEAGAALWNATVFIFLVFFVFAVLGVQLFSKDWVDPDGELGVYAHFQEIGVALLTLFRFATGENWNGFMYSMLAENDGCKDLPDYKKDGPFCIIPDVEGTKYGGKPCNYVNGCPNKIYLYVYFYSFTVIVAFVMINLFVGVIVEAHDQSKTVCILEEYETRPFFAKWVDPKFNPENIDNTEIPVMKVKDLEPFFARIPKPLGFKGTPHGVLRQKVMNILLASLLPHDFPALPSPSIYNFPLSRMCQELIGEMQIRVRRGPYKESLDKGLPFDEVELDLMDVFEGAVRQAARIKRHEDVVTPPGSRPSEGGLRAIFGDFKVRSSLQPPTPSSIWSFLCTSNSTEIHIPLTDLYPNNLPYQISEIRVRCFLRMEPPRKAWHSRQGKIHTLRENPWPAETYGSCPCSSH